MSGRAHSSGVVVNVARTQVSHAQHNRARRVLYNFQIRRSVRGVPPCTRNPPFCTRCPPKCTRCPPVRTRISSGHASEQNVRGMSADSAGSGDIPGTSEGCTRSPANAPSRSPLRKSRAVSAGEVFGLLMSLAGLWFIHLV